MGYHNYVINQNFKNDFNISNFNNPYKNLEFINFNKNIELLKKYENKTIATSYFKKCGSPLCRKSNNNQQHHQCNCKIKINYFVTLCGTILCDVYFKGFHSYNFYPTKLYIRKNKSLLKEITFEKTNLEIKNNIENKKKEIYQKYSYSNEYEDESFFINNKQISNLKNRLKKKEIGDSSKSFINSINLLKGINENKNEEIRCLEEIIYSENKKIKIEDMLSEDFIFIYYNIKFIEENLESIYNNISMDSCYKLASHDNGKQFYNIPTLILNGVTQKLHGFPIFIINLKPINAYTISVCILNCLNLIEKINFDKNKKIEDCNPLFTIDKGSCEVASLEILKINFVLCEWHIINAILRHLKLQSENKFKILIIIKKIIGSKNENYLNDQVDYLKYVCQKLGINNFYEYFIKEYGNYFNNITQKFKKNSFGITKTNNISEYQFKSIQKYILRINRIDLLIQKMIKYLKNRYKEIKNIKYSPKFLNDFKFNLSLTNNFNVFE